jgi:hypothetical protein
MPGEASNFKAADLNKDDLTDLVVTNWNAYSFTVFLGTGLGTFGSPVVYPSGQAGSMDLIDYDHDGWLDVVVAEKDQATIAFFRNDQAGGFTGPVRYSTPGPVWMVRTGDFNRDGLLDVAASYDAEPAGVAVFIGNPDGTFSGPFAYTDGSRGALGSPNIALGDFDGDGWTDILLVMFDHVRLLKNAGDGTFSPFGSSLAITGSQPSAGDSSERVTERSRIP